MREILNRKQVDNYVRIELLKRFTEQRMNTIEPKLRGNPILMRKIKFYK